MLLCKASGRGDNMMTTTQPDIHTQEETLGRAMKVIFRMLHLLTQPQHGSDSSDTNEREWLLVHHG